MLGIVLITHGNLGKELLAAAEFVLGSIPQSDAVTLTGAEDADRLTGKLQESLTRVDRGDGAIILTDMFGGTPSNISLAFLEEGKREVVTGVNLPMIIKAASERDGKTLEELAAQVCKAGRDSISVAGQILAS